MHAAIMHPWQGVEVDHIRIGSGLDNRRSNLRLVPHWVNIRNRGMQRNNTSGYPGVHWDKTNRIWVAHIKIRGAQRRIGRYHTAEEASAAYEAEREKIWAQALEEIYAIEKISRQEGRGII